MTSKQRSRSFILVPIDFLYATSYRLSMVTFALWMHSLATILHVIDDDRRQRRQRTERRTDDMRSQDRALHWSASSGKNGYTCCGSCRNISRSDNLYSFYRFYRAMHFSASAVLLSHVVSKSVCPSVTSVDCWNSSKIISPSVSPCMFALCNPNITGLLQGEKPWNFRPNRGGVLKKVAYKSSNISETRIWGRIGSHRPTRFRLVPNQRPWMTLKVNCTLLQNTCVFRSSLWKFEQWSNYSIIYEGAGKYGER